MMILMKKRKKKKVNNDYLTHLNQLSFNELECIMREYAVDNKIPIIQDEGLAFLKQIISIKKPKKILEIGTAIGYSSICMANVCNSHIDTIEINEEIFLLAKENIKKSNLNINPILGNALELDDILFQKDYDLIFIDAAKAQYKKFFTKFSKFLNNDGLIICDNLLFHGLVEEENIESKNLRKMVEKIKDFNSWLIEQSEFDSYIYQIGDGMSLSLKR